MARYKAIIAYDGTGFYGSQRQKGCRTVQSEIENALRAIGWNGKSILLAGRTDTGVHATGQVASFDIEWFHSCDDLRRALNANLSSDIVIREVKIAPEKFHPRFDATSRRYQYSLFCDSVRDPLRERYAWRVWPPVSDLKSLSSIWLGTHNFASFGTSPRNNGKTFRTITHARWQHYKDEWVFEIQAESFLYRMVRRLVHIQVAVGQKRLSVDDLKLALEKRTSILAGIAPAKGLTLVEISYNNLV